MADGSAGFADVGAGVADGGTGWAGLDEVGSGGTLCAGFALGGAGAVLVGCGAGGREVGGTAEPRVAPAGRVP